MGKILRFAQNDTLWSWHPEPFGRTQDELREDLILKLSHYLVKLFLEWLLTPGRAAEQ
jgi:hypothetical protein